MTDSGWLILKVFRADSLPPGCRPRYNIAPGQTVLAALGGPENRRLGHLRWGLVPSWAADPSTGYKMIQARAETLATKPGFRRAFRKRRCAIVADGFYEWRRDADAGKTKQPYYFRLRSGRPFAFAGLWERWLPRSGRSGRDRGSGPGSEPASGQGIQGTVGGDVRAEGGARIDVDSNIADPAPLYTCTIVTTTANALTEPIHHRMPVILDEETTDRWLDEGEMDPDVLEPLLRPFDSDEMQVQRVSPRVNSPKVDDRECVQPVE